MSPLSSRNLPNTELIPFSLTQSGAHVDLDYVLLQSLALAFVRNGVSEPPPKHVRKQVVTERDAVAKRRQRPLGRPLESHLAHVVEKTVTPRALAVVGRLVRRHAQTRRDKQQRLDPECVICRSKLQLLSDLERQVAAERVTSQVERAQVVLVHTVAVTLTVTVTVTNHRLLNELYQRACEVVHSFLPIELEVVHARAARPCTPRHVDEVDVAQWKSPPQIRQRFVEDLQSTREPM